MFDGGIHIPPAVGGLQRAMIIVCIPIAATEDSRQQVHQAAAQFILRAVLVPLWFSLARSNMFYGGTGSAPAVGFLQSTVALVGLPIAATDDSW